MNQEAYKRDLTAFGTDKLTVQYLLSVSIIQLAYWKR